MPERVDLLSAPDWFQQPGDGVVSAVVALMKAEPVFARIFGDSIYDYQRMDIGIREMPAARLYSPTGRKEAETWYYSGDLKLDIIFPASIRRSALQRFPSLLTSAMVAWLRAQPTFRAAANLVPGLNQLGWFFAYDNTLAFKPGEDVDPCPMTQLTFNWRVLLNDWDAFAESDARTRDEPFRQTLRDLETLYTTILAKDDGGTTQVSVPLNATPTEE